MKLMTSKTSSRCPECVFVCLRACVRACVRTCVCPTVCVCALVCARLCAYFRVSVMRERKMPGLK